MKRYLSIIAALSLLLLSCAKEQILPQGSVTIQFATVTQLTKVVTPGDRDVLDGGGIVVGSDGKPDVFIFIMDRTGAIVARYPDDDPSAGVNSDCISTHTANTPDVQTSVRFRGLDKGTYTVFALANTEDLDSSVSTALSAAGTLDDLDGILLSVTGSALPSFANAMPLTAKGSVVVNSKGNGNVDLPMLRVVAKVGYSFKNLTGEDLALHECTVTLHEMNPSQGYLFQHSSDYVSGADRNLVFNNATLEIEDKALISNPSLVFPSIAPAQATGNRYLCDVTFRIVKDSCTYDADDPDTYHAYSFRDMPVHDRRSSDIPSLERNQFLSIETSISRKKTEFDISFNFLVCGWTENEDEVFFH